MAGERSLLVVVTHLSKEELDFFQRFGAVPAGPNDAAYLGPHGTACSPGESAVVLLLGNRRHRTERIVAAALETGADLQRAYLLVHPGGGIDLRSGPGMGDPPEDPAHEAVWEGLMDRSFAWSTGGKSGGPNVLGRFLRGDLASSRGDGEKFTAALALLLEALEYAVAQRPGGVECAEKRSDLVQKDVDNPYRRVRAGLDAHLPAAAPRNPVGAIIHDVVGPLEPLLMDLDSTREEPEYLDDIRKQYASQDASTKLANDLAALAAVILGAETERLRTSLSAVQLYPVDEIIRLLRPSSGADANPARNLEQIRGSLRDLVTEDPGWQRLNQLTDAQSWISMREAESTRVILADWSTRLKSRFRDLELLFGEKFGNVRS